MVLPTPWCTKYPQPCVKATGIVGCLFAVLAGILLVLLPLLLLDHDHEIDYIQKFNQGVDSESAAGVNRKNLSFTLNITDIYNIACNDLTTSINDFLGEYLPQQVKYIVALIRTEVIQNMDANGQISSNRILCEIHVRTRKNPRDDIVVVKGERYSVAKIVALTISKHTNQDVAEIRKKFNVIGPKKDQIAVLKIYPRYVGNDPERAACIKDHIRGVDKQVVLKIENMMYNLFAAAAGLSLIAGILLTSSAFILSRFLLMITFLIEVISITLIASGVVAANDPSLCLYQYGGLSVYAVDSPKYMQTIITYGSVIYAIPFKFYVLWMILAYAEVVPSLKKLEKSPDHSRYVAQVALEVDQKNQAAGGKNADIDDIDISDDEETKTLTISGSSDRSTISKKSQDLHSAHSGKSYLDIERRENEIDSIFLSPNPSTTHLGAPEVQGKGKFRRKSRLSQADNFYFGGSSTQKKDKALFKQSFFGTLD